MSLPRALCGGFPRAQNRAIELRESKVLSSSHSGSDVLVRLSAVVHVSTGIAGLDPGTMWSQEVELVISGGVLERAPPQAGTLWIASGFVLFIDADDRGGAKSERSLFLPAALERSGPVRLELRGDEGELLVRGDSLKIVARGEQQFLDRFEGQVA